MLQPDPSQAQPRRLYVDVTGTTCPKKGSPGLLEALVRAVKRAGLESRVEVVARGCFGLCQLAPNMYVEPDGIWYSRFTARDIPIIVRRHLLGNKPVERLIHYPERKVNPKRKGKKK
ncbi:MAG: (2Fe-2S) ferredoxin domain-containing protein [Candidatus Omnitrophica bacterium]|nr:(2Fe-2S) ferredoxin domain-containing protein [Candidatus Omnitrophota bacterium]